MVLEFANPLSVENKRGNFTELTSRSLQLGDRVRRGPDWHYGNQDKQMAGTVIGQQSHGTHMYIVFVLVFYKSVTRTHI